MHLFAGNLGHLLVIVSLISALITGMSYWISLRQSNPVLTEGWMVNGRWAFHIHALSSLGIIFTLFFIIASNWFEYHYAWSHSSRLLPVYYKISAFWEGQEGSFLLWIFWHLVLGYLVIYTSGKWEAPVMFVFSLVQFFLVSMILGVSVLNIKIGSSPFMLVREVISDPIFTINPDFVPEDGTGLNPLLQNYWMVIHPPTLFLGFALTLVPFSFAIAGLWLKKFTGWIRPALPWMHITAAVLGAGILMGAIWAYETLNFGGYWNWDPVENAVYVPWLIVIASLHVMIIFKKNRSYLRLSFLLVVSAFLLILYSTFLTRSGILGEASVHSFTDLGLSGQLLIYLFVFIFLSLLLLLINWNKIPVTHKELFAYNGEFWIFIGALVLTLGAFQVIIPTSFPVINALTAWLGFETKLAAPADQVIFYSNFQIWLGIAIATLSGTAQYFWWKRVERKNLWQIFSVPIILTLILSTLLIIIFKIGKISYILLITAGIFTLLSNGRLIFKLAGSRFRLSGGAVAHSGMALMLIGILASSGYSRVVSLNNTGFMYSNEFPDEVNKENLLLFLHEPRQMGDYTLTYEGKKIREENKKLWISKTGLRPTPDSKIFRSGTILTSGEDTLIHEMDTLIFNPENTYYEVSYEPASGKKFTLYPRLQVNPNMGNVVSPSIRRGLFSDMYTHVTVVPNEEKDWTDAGTKEVKMNETFFLNDYITEWQSLDRIFSYEGIPLGDQDVGVKARIQISGNERTYLLEPLYIIKDNLAGQIPDENAELGIRIGIKSINPGNNSITFQIHTAQKDYIILKAIEKPLINLLWIGSMVVITGFGIASARRFSERKKKNE